MHLSVNDLFHLNDEWLNKLTSELLLEVSKRLLRNVEGLEDRLNQNTNNNWCPPTSEALWAKTGGSEEPS